MLFVVLERATGGEALFLPYVETDGHIMDCRS